jgi:flavin-dependent dehydrogenase
LLERIVATGCPAVTASVTDLGDFPLEARELVVDGVAFGYGPRRSVMDRVFVDAAVDAGAELREGFSVDDVILDGDRVAGIRGRTLGGTTSITERGRIVIGADGRHSRIAAAVRAPVYDAYPAVACWYFSYWSGVAGDALEIYARRDRVIFMFPTNDRLAAIFVGWPIETLTAVRSQIESSFMAAIDGVPQVGERVRAGRREERFFGAADMANFFRKPYGQGWALVGDAGCHKDPYLALGICDALRDVDLLVDSLDEGLSGRCDLEVALARYEHRRNEESRVDYWQNLSAARFEPPPEEVYRIRAAVRGDEEATRQYFLAREGLIAPPHAIQAARSS